ncbi:pentatricopeptide repeat-containing protein At5g56310-like [Rosa rugosa]|uniref:pentatricopeptide repeat-containing protein At5g56310-like n=1 Tax=Rosa rugosa TaxID=74645 RepID=UPI002B411634|nr:pentatricopeptide repeat-containing protein At5g56310-like [Rosa rugosa]
MDLKSIVCDLKDYLKPTTSSTTRALEQRLFHLLQQSCSTVRNLTQIHTQILVHGFTQKSYLLSKLLALYVGCGCLDNALRVFGNVKSPSTTVWNQIIRGYAGSETPGKAVELYNRLAATEAEPDGYTYSYVVSACARSGMVREGEQLHGRVLGGGFGSNVFVQTSLVSLYAGGGGLSGGVECARKVFDEMRERSVVSWNTLLSGYVRSRDFDGARRVFDGMPERNVVSWTTMIAGCAQNGRCKEALSLFGRMRKANVEPDQVALVAVLSACAEIGDLRFGRWVHWYVEEGLCVRAKSRLVTLYNALIHMYASCGLVDEAYKVFKQMPRRSTVSWTSIIVGFAKQGRGEEALRIFQLMLSSELDDVRPDEITFLGVLCGCSHAGLVDEGRRLFKFMTQTWGLEPRIEHYGCMVDLLSRAGLLNEAHVLVETMPMEPNDAVWGALLGGCMLHKNSELASLAAQKLTVALDPDQAAGYLVLLSNVYASAKRWLDVAYVRQKMVHMGVKKPPGRSWVQINGAVHGFVAGDRTHKHEYLIYEMLGEITRQAQQEGREPDTLNMLSLED